MSARSIGGAFGAIVGHDRVADDPGTLAAAAIDGRVPRWVVRPRSIDDVAAVVAVAFEDGLAVAPRGSGSAVELGSPPSRLDVVLDLRALDRVVEWNPDDLTVSVEAGVTLGDLSTRLADRRQFLPLDPPGGTARTLGGIASTNAIGPLACRYGSMRDFLLGVRFVQADGVATWGGAKVVKSVTGYDVPKLMVGSLGTLGVIVELTLRLHPLPDTERTWILTTSSLEALQACLDALTDSPLQPNRVEVLDTGALAGFGVGDAKAALAVSFGSVADAVHEQGERLVAIGRSAGASVTERATEIWGDIERVATAADGAVALDIGTLPARVAGTIRTLIADPVVFDSGARCTVTGRATLGALRAVVRGAPPADIAAMVARLRATVAHVGGSVVVGRGPRELRTLIDPWGPIEPSALGLMRALKDEFDPRGVLNPGRFVGGL